MLKTCLNIFALSILFTTVGYAKSPAPHNQGMHLVCKARLAPNTDSLEIYSSNGSNWFAKNANYFRNERTESFSHTIAIRSARLNEHEYSFSATEPSITAMIQGRDLPFYDFRLQLSRDIIGQSHIATLQNMGPGQFTFTCCPIDMGFTEDRAFCTPKK